MESKKTEIKICGITQLAEADYLNEAEVDYAGFVLFPPSKRNISIPEAEMIMQQLKPGIRKVAVTVSPLVEVIEEVNRSGFDVLQIHGRLSEQQLKAARIPVWYAFNIADPAELEAQERFLAELPPELSSRIRGIVVDAADFGSGQTFNWQDHTLKWRSLELMKDRSFILAGGLKAENVALGMQIFDPDVVDVSSGVEIAREIRGKDPVKIMEFCRQVRAAAEQKQEEL